jgi:hypothetical protein
MLRLVSVIPPRPPEPGRSCQDWYASVGWGDAQASGWGSTGWRAIATACWNVACFRILGWERAFWWGLLR